MNYSQVIAFFKKIDLSKILGLFIVIISILLFLSILSYSPDDPNFIFSNEKIENKKIYLVFMEAQYLVYFYNLLV